MGRSISFFFKKNELLLCVKVIDTGTPLKFWLSQNVTYQELVGLCMQEHRPMFSQYAATRSSGTCHGASVASVHAWLFVVSIFLFCFCVPKKND